MAVPGSGSWLFGWTAAADTKLTGAQPPSTWKLPGEAGTAAAVNEWAGAKAPSARPPGGGDAPGQAGNAEAFGIDSAFAIIPASMAAFDAAFDIAILMRCCDQPLNLQTHSCVVMQRRSCS
mmetsp:Transcript_44459/g.79916  ORF Transcript_44459/g.79916 Transcript_44459/m.79916 type:complete len:121 (-) Transcript_44459:2-364(-)